MSMANHQQYDHVVKFMLVGSSGVGKTAFMHRFCEDTYTGKLPATIGLDYKQKIVTSNGVRYLVQLWDTAGQERFANLTPSYYRSAMGIFLCYSVEDRQSFNSIAVWIKQIKKYSEEKLPILIIGNKCDLIRRQVLEKDGKAVAELYGVDFIEASAKEDINVKAAVNKLLEKVKLKIGENERSRFKLSRLTDNRNGCRC